MLYANYIAFISNEPSYYGSACTQTESNFIAAELASRVKERFPGINVVDGGGKTRGPESGVVDEINEWIGDNWMAALRVARRAS